MSLANKSSSAIALLLGVTFPSIGAIMFLGVAGETILIFCQALAIEKRSPLIILI